MPFKDLFCGDDNVIPVSEEESQRLYSRSMEPNGFEEHAVTDSLLSDEASSGNPFARDMLFE